LTPREYEVFTYLLTGLLNKQIGAELDIAEKTVKIHRAQVMAKLGVQSIAELVHMAHKVDIEPPPV
jgi:FixJ family two-component response regulator